jgi:hypothetical protein
MIIGTLNCGKFAQVASERERHGDRFNTSREIKALKRL